MLGKLLKYEFIATGRIFLPLYAALLIVSFISSFTLQVESAILTAVSVLLLFLAYFALFIITCFILIQRFYSNLLRDEGYLMFTLPTTPSALIASKLITAGFWCILSIKVGALAMLIISRVFVDIGWIISEMFANVPYVLNYVPVFFIVLLVILFLVYLALVILHIYFSLAVGQLPPFGRYKILGAIVTYIGFSVLMQIVGSALVMGVGAYFNSVAFDSLIFYHPIHPFGTELDMVWGVVNSLLVGTIIFHLVFAAGAFIGTSLILKKKLNLE